MKTVETTYRHHADHEDARQRPVDADGARAAAPGR
jgi:hypothetical protein